MGEKEKSREVFRKAFVGFSELTSAMFYNDQPPETIFYFYQSAALLKLGKKSEAHCRYLIGLKYLCRKAEPELSHSWALYLGGHTGTRTQDLLHVN